MSLLSLLSTLLLLSPLAAAEALTEEDAVARALARSPSQAALSAAVDAAEATADGTRLFEEPELRLGVSGILDDTPTWDTRVRLPMGRPGEVRAERTAARLEQQALQQERAADARSVAGTVRHLHHQARLLEELVEHGAREAQAAETAMGVIDTRLAAGGANRLDWLEAAEDRQEARERHREAELRHARVMGALRGMLGLPGDAALELTGDDLRARGSGTPTAVAAAQDRVVAADPALAAARLRASDGALPSPKPTLTYVQLEGQWEMDSPEKLVDTGVIVGVEVPLWGGGRQRAAASRLELQQLGSEADALEAQVRQEAAWWATEAAVAQAAWQDLGAQLAEAETAMANLRRSADTETIARLDAWEARIQQRETEALMRLVAALDALDALSAEAP